jgi:hypothetical protein
MRKSLFSLLWIIPLLLSGYVNAQYCTTGGPTSTADSNIESVTITGENGSSISYTGCPGVTGVENQLAQSVDLSPGESYTLSVKFGTCGGNYAGAGAAWIDFDGDGDYAVAENVGESTGNPNAAPWNAPVLFNFTVPVGASFGTTRMRVVQRESGTLPLDPCVGFFWGSAIEFTVNVILPAPPAPEQDLAAPTCSAGTDLTVPGSPDPGIEWYWQETSTGTSTANEVDGAFTVFSNGIYYVRAYDPIEDIWSPASSITVSNFPLAIAPPAPIAAANPSCIPGTEITMAGTPDPDVTWYWQGTNSLGTSTALDASDPFAVTASGTYYVAAFDAATGCWSEAVGTAVVVNSTLPNAPDAVQASYAYCSNASSMEIAVEETPIGCPIEVTIFSAGWGDGTTWTVTDNDGVTVLSGGTYGNGYSDTQTIPSAANGPYTLTLVSTMFDNSPNYSVSVDGTVVFSGTGTASSTTVVTPFGCPAGGATVEWYDEATGGNLLGTGAVLEALGTSVLPSPAASGTYQFYVANNLDGCESATRTLIEVIVSEVNVELLAVDETCINYADGSFTLGTVLCGDAPFSYSIDGGAFDAVIPTDLTEGTYSIVVQDDNGNESAPITLVIEATGTVIPANPEAGTPDFYACTGATSLEVGDIQTQGTAGLTTTLAGGNGCTGGAMMDLIATSGNITVTSLDIVPAATGAQTVNVYTKNGTYVGSQTVAGDWTLLGSYAINGTIGQVVNIDVDDFTINQGDVTGVYVNFNAQYTTVPAGTSYTDGNLTIQVGSGLCGQFAAVLTPRGFNGTVYYDVLVPSSLSPADIFWYDANVGGTLIGTGDELETIGTSVISSPAAAGTYEFYAYGHLDGCFSEESALVTVNIADVVVEFDGIAATCNNGASGSFALANVECGTAPFTFSVDGGAFGTIPNDLVPGPHTVVVMDDTGAESAEYTVVVPDADAPSDVVIVASTLDGAEVSWTPGALETEWNVEWGLPGFVPGTGDELGSTTVTSPEYIITGLSDNEFYDVYVSANCGAGSTPGDWTSNTFLTLCGPIQGQFFCEDFSSTSLTKACWTVLDVNGDGNPANPNVSYSWNLNYAINPFVGDQVAMMYTDFNNGNNDDWLISPNLTLTGNEVLNFYYRVQSAFEPNDFQVLLSTTGTNPADFTDTLMFLASYDNITYQDTTVDLSAYTGDVYIAWHVPPGGLDGWRLYIDQVCIDVCTPPAGIDGSVDACRLDELTNLNDIVVKGQEENGYWSFPSNENLIVNDSLLNVELLPSGSYDVLWVTVGGCTNDTTVATVTVFPPSSAGINGTITVCRNQPINLFEGLSGNVDMGGTWYDPQNNPLPNSQPQASNIPGSFNYDYVVSNGVCPADSTFVEVIVDGDCNFLSLGEEQFAELSVYPNPATDVINIANPSNLGELGVEMLDINGRVVYASSSLLMNTDAATVDISRFERGVYTLRIFNNDGQSTFKVVKH